MPDRFELAVILITAVLAGFCFAMSRYVPREERLIRRRRRRWEEIARARSLTFGERFDLRGSDPRVGELTLGLELAEWGQDPVLVASVPLQEAPSFEFELVPRGRDSLHTRPWSPLGGPLGDPAIDGAFNVLTTDLAALQVFLGPAARALIAAHPRWHVGVRGRRGLVGWADFDPSTEAEVFDEAVELLRVLFRAPS